MHPSERTVCSSDHAPAAGSDGPHAACLQLDLLWPSCTRMGPPLPKRRPHASRAPTVRDGRECQPDTGSTSCVAAAAGYFVGGAGAVVDARARPGGLIID